MRCSKCGKFFEKKETLDLHNCAHVSSTDAATGDNKEISPTQVFNDSGFLRFSYSIISQLHCLHNNMQPI